ncbi:MAG TPA: GxxExxY protein [Gemmatimonadaceae bacterium]|jgi:GxxExxY protein|nr:GxxExxY protein [Gemmatimonadaceae bacterium]
MELREPFDDPLTHEIIGQAIAIHRELGPGLLESVYEFFLTQELVKAGLRVERQKPIPVEYAGHRVDLGFRPDLIVNGCVIVEIKAVQKLERIHEAQLLSYMRLAEIDLGLLINFHADPLKDGIRRLSLKKNWRITGRGSISD